MRTILLAGAIVILGWPAGAWAQDYRRIPSDLAPPAQTGFAPDPYVIVVQAGGGVSVGENLSSFCVGHVAEAPNLSLTFQTDGRLPLLFRAESDADTVLVIREPGGRWVCDDDGGGGLNPLIRFSQPKSGTYDVFVGTFQAGAPARARLIVTERDEPSTSAPAQAFSN